MFSLFLSHRGWIPAAFLCIENQKVRGGEGMVCFAREVPVICRTRWLLVVGTGVRSWLLSVLIFNPAESGSKRNRPEVG